MEKIYELRKRRAELWNDAKIFLDGHRGSDGCLDHQRVNNLRAEQEDLEKYAGLKVGSMDEASTNGNWESL